MKFLLDCHADQVQSALDQWPQVVAGHLLTPLTKYKCCPAGPFAIDNGAYSQFREQAWRALLQRNAVNASRCLFVCLPDVVGSATATRALWRRWLGQVPGCYPLAYVAQDGHTGAVPASADAVFIGGTDAFQDAPATLREVRAWVRDGLHVHVGRVNAVSRFLAYHEAGAHTCDGSGASQRHEKLARIAASLGAPVGKLF